MFIATFLFLDSLNASELVTRYLFLFSRNKYAFFQRTFHIRKEKRQNKTLHLYTSNVNSLRQDQSDTTQVIII